MNALWFYLTFLCLTFKKCSAEVLPTGDVANFASFKGSQYSTRRVEHDYSSRGTSCPQQHSWLGPFKIALPGLEPFEILCDYEITGAGYTVIASRSNVELNFFRNWTEYKRGFGNYSGDFFIGLDKLHAITKSQPYELYIHLEDFEGNTRFARYDEFYIESENALYKLSTLGTYTGDAGDSLGAHKGKNFTTYDNDNNSEEKNNCAIGQFGAWWFGGCPASNLFGMYYAGQPASYPTGIVWYYWRGTTYSYKTMKMLLRPKYVCSNQKK
ncbi:ficolin-2 isoform X2 [Drosophila willistoni]|uniref:ficolin-2 isoform X2 n=1 Tax=Drosophila willistoni TaxID=7260 RepID=UPI000C26D8CF|nr:ficolin-2 isoform X2 [Drosophila willistoni]